MFENFILCIFQSSSLTPSSRVVVYPAHQSSSSVHVCLYQGACISKALNRADMKKALNHLVLAFLVSGQSAPLCVGCEACLVRPPLSVTAKNGMLQIVCKQETRARMQLRGFATVGMQKALVCVCISKPFGFGIILALRSVPGAPGIRRIDLSD